MIAVAEARAPAPVVRPPDRPGIASPRADSAPARPLPVAEGPSLPPLPRGLPHTSMRSIQALFAYTLLYGMRERDKKWAASDDFITVCVYAGLEIDTAETIQQLYLDDKLDMRRITYAMVGTGVV